MRDPHLHHLGGYADGGGAPRTPPEFIAASQASRAILQSITRIGPADSATLIAGETGVGKEVVARLIHAASPRRARPIVVVDCASLHEQLLQSELFGHEKGAFTGAVQQKLGLFEVAHDGTVFLDEVGEASLEVQAKLLRVIESGQFRRVGGTTEITVDARVLSATNRDLWAAARGGRFREDLLYRLSTLTIRIPPLRERPEDIVALVDHFAREVNRKLGVAKEFGAEALCCLTRYSWPGNVRELSHVVEQAIVLAEHGTIETQDLPATVRLGLGATFATSGEPSDLPLHEVERRHVLLVMEHAKGNRGLAAKTLGISVRNLYRLLKKYGWKERVRRGSTAMPDQADRSDTSSDGGTS